MSEDRQVVVGETADGTEVTLPVVELLTGRGFVTGKSGSGKSNTASVIAEELLDAGFPLLIVDTDGEYYGLKEEYEMLHAGADEECDIQIGPEHAEQMATLALEENVPIILDVSGYLDEEVADELLRKTAKQLFVKEKKLKKPFLLVVEEVHEYIPEGGGVGETGKLLIKIGKRGRKHGLGILGISQRPADVKKDFITQANWLVWHRLTWDNDTKVVGRIIDNEYAERVSDLGDGEAYVQTDWTETDVRRIQFRRKRTFDAGATPGLDDFERPELKSVSDALVGELQEISERKQSEESRIEELEERLEQRERRIEELEEELAAARDVSNAAEQMAQALSTQGTVQTQLPEMGEEFRQLHEELVELETERVELEDRLEEFDDRLAERDERIAELEAQLAEKRERNETLEGHIEALCDRIEELRSGETSSGGAESDGSSESDRIVHADGDDLEFGYTSTNDESSDILVANADPEAESMTDGAAAGASTSFATEDRSEDSSMIDASAREDTPVTDDSAAVADSTVETDESPAVPDESAGTEADSVTDESAGDSEPSTSAEDEPSTIADDAASTSADDAVSTSADGAASTAVADPASTTVENEPTEADNGESAFEFGTEIEDDGSDDADDDGAEGTVEADDAEPPSIDDSEPPSIDDSALPPLDERVTAAADVSRCTVRTAREVVATLAADGQATTEDLATAVDRSTVAVQSLLSELRIRGVLDRSEDGRYELEPEAAAALEERTEE